MTLMVKSESHGEVESGFYAGFTKFARLGDYTFVTRYFCDLAKYLAEKPSSKEGIMLGFDLDKFWQRESDYSQELIMQISEALEAKRSNQDRSQQIDMSLKKLQRGGYENPLEDEVDLDNERIAIPVKVSDDGGFIEIGKYNISALHFGRMVVYLANGGFFGWFDNDKPDFAEPTLESIKTSKNSLYREIQREL